MSVQTKQQPSHNSMINPDHEAHAIFRSHVEFISRDGEPQLVTQPCITGELIESIRLLTPSGAGLHITMERREVRPPELIDLVRTTPEAWVRGEGFSQQYIHNHDDMLNQRQQEQMIRGNALATAYGECFDAEPIEDMRLYLPKTQWWMSVRFPSFPTEQYNINVSVIQRIRD